MPGLPQRPASRSAVPRQLDDVARSIQWVVIQVGGLKGPRYIPKRRWRLRPFNPPIMHTQTSFELLLTDEVQQKPMCGRRAIGDCLLRQSPWQSCTRTRANVRSVIEATSPPA